MIGTHVVFDLNPSLIGEMKGADRIKAKPERDINSENFETFGMKGINPTMNIWEPELCAGICLVR